MSKPLPPHISPSIYRRPLPGTALHYFDAQAAVDAICPGAWANLPYTSRVHAENLVRRCDPTMLAECLTQIALRKRERDFPWFPARVVCHDILGQTALVDLAGLRDAIADQGGDPAAVNPVVPVQLIVDHSLAVEYGGSGITCNALAPGFVRTDFTQGLQDNPQFQSFLSTAVPAGRWAEPDDIAPAVVYLAAPGAAFVNGQVLAIDGGLLARM